VAHGSGYNMWQEGGMATRGVESVAETGATGTLLGEIDESSSTGDVVVGSVTFNSNTQMQTFDSITMTSTTPYLSTITMIAPSPDWFTGFYDFDAINPDTQTWYREFSLATYPWDAGTEEGNNYSGNNAASNPQEPILLFDENTVPSTGVLLNDSGDDVLPVASWTCTLEQPDPDPIEDLDEVICFPGNSLVEVKGKGLVSLDQLNVGDKVKVGNDSFDYVYSFGHKTHSGKFSYLQIKTTEKPHPLEISKNHMVFVVDIKTGKKHAVPASYVKVGDWLYTDVMTPAKVENIITVFREGAYAPFTMSGTIVVNGVLSSSYVSLQGTDTFLIGSVKTPLNMHVLSHFFTSPYRLLSRIGLSMKERYNEDGMSTWIDLPYNFSKYLLTQNHVIIMGAFFLLSTIAILPVYTAELVMSSYLFQLSLVFAAACVLLSGVFTRSYRIRKKAI